MIDNGFIYDSVVLSISEYPYKGFLPAAGNGDGSSLNNEGSNGNVWSSSLNSVGSSNAFNCNFNSGGFNPDNNNNRYNGFSVRGVLADYIFYFFIRNFSFYI